MRGRWTRKYSQCLFNKPNSEIQPLHCSPKRTIEITFEFWYLALYFEIHWFDLEHRSPGAHFMHSCSIRGVPFWPQINCEQNRTETKCIGVHHHNLTPSNMKNGHFRVYLATDWQRQKRQSSVAAIQNQPQNWPPAGPGKTAVLGPKLGLGSWQNSSRRRLASKSAHIFDWCLALVYTTPQSRCNSHTTHLYTLTHFVFVICPANGRRRLCVWPCV